MLEDQTKSTVEILPQVKPRRRYRRRGAVALRTLGPTRIEMHKLLLFAEKLLVMKPVVAEAVLSLMSTIADEYDTKATNAREIRKKRIALQKKLAGPRRVRIRDAKFWAPFSDGDGDSTSATWDHVVRTIEDHELPADTTV